jgi:S1-C subfamily serine protease
MKRFLAALAVLTVLAPKAYSHHRTIRAVKRALPSTVSIVVTTPNTKGWYIGSGVIIRSDGLIVTNAHIVDQGTRYKIRLSNGKTYRAKLVGFDRSRDVGLLKIKSRRKFPVARLGRSRTLALGQDLIVIGNPYGMSHSVSKGIVSALNRKIYISGMMYKNLIQTDAPLNPGNSGGPVIDLKGKVIAIAMAIHRFANSIGFAIPIDIVKRVVKRILKNPRKYRRKKTSPIMRFLPKGMRKFLPLPP